MFQLHENCWNKPLSVGEGLIARQKNVCLGSYSGTPDFTIVDLTINILCLGKLYAAKSRFNNRTPVQKYSLYYDGNG